MKKIIKTIAKKWYVLIGIGIFFLLVKDMKFAELKQAFLEIKPLYYFLAGISYIPLTIINSYRWKKIMDTQDIHYSAKEAFYMFGAGALIGLATPGKLGDFSKMAYLKKDNHSLARAFLGSFLDKIFDLFFVFAFTIVALLFVNFPFKIYFDYFPLLKIALPIIAIGAMLASYLYRKHMEKIKPIILEIWNDLKKFTPKKFLTILFITATSWIGYIYIFYLIGASMGLNRQLGFFYFAFAAIFGTLSALVPISILGVGTRELAIVALFAPLGIPRETAILYSLLIASSYIFAGMVYFYCYLKRPLIGNTKLDKDFKGNYGRINKTLE